MQGLQSIQNHLVAIYGEEQGFVTYQRLLELSRFKAGMQDTPGEHERGKVDQRDAILITYGDQVQSDSQPPLRVLREFCQNHLSEIVSGLHILPFYPYSSDDGFSVIDYQAVDPALGTWQDIRRFSREQGGQFRLMFDAVINHISIQSAWFQGFLHKDPRFSDFFITIAGEQDLSQVVRPRALPLLTRFKTDHSAQSVWTTFSADQVDLNYHNPDVLLAIIDTLLFYAAQGAEFIRLDAIAYLWKEISSTCIHLPQTHQVIQLFRQILDLVAPQVLLITETNVPHEENVSYFGDGHNEAQLVYNFALPPLVLHTLRTGNTSALCNWAANLHLPSSKVTFFNFLASHDGIGLNPARGILNTAEIAALVENTQNHGGLVSYKNNADGSQSPYELNINYFDALSNPLSNEPEIRQIDRFLAAQFIMLSLMGVPGIYFHSLLGSRGWPEGVAQTGRNRSINRQKLDLAPLETALADPSSIRSQVFSRYASMLKIRAQLAAFHPNADQRILNFGDAIFALLRGPFAGSQPVLCLLNASPQPQTVKVEWADLGLTVPKQVTEQITNCTISLAPDASLQLEPYQYGWYTFNR